MYMCTICDLKHSRATAFINKYYIFISGMIRRLICLFKNHLESAADFKSFLYQNAENEQEKPSIGVGFCGAAVRYSYIRFQIRIVIMLEVPVERTVVYHFDLIIEYERFALAFGRRFNDLASLNDASN